jgi:2Fe-2S ferredoxin
MPEMTFRTVSGDFTVEGREGYSLMELGISNDVPGIAGDCGGVLACATCHVRIAAPWREKTGEPEANELDMLEAVEAPNVDSRLCCQILWRDDLDGLVVEVPGE